MGRLDRIFLGDLCHIDFEIYETLLFKKIGRVFMFLGKTKEGINSLFDLDFIKIKSLNSFVLFLLDDYISLVNIL